jgi:hypothetical protein
MQIRSIDVGKVLRAAERRQARREALANAARNVFALTWLRERTNARTGIARTPKRRKIRV